MKNDEKQLLVKAKSGCKESLWELHQRYQYSVRNFGRNYFRKFTIPTLDEDDIDSIVDTYLLNVIPTIDIETKYSLYTILINSIRFILNNNFRHFFAAKRCAGNFLTGLEDLYCEPSFEDKGTRDFIIHDYLNTVEMTQLERNVAVAAIIDGYKPREISSMLSITPKAVCNTFSRARKKIKNHWQKMRDF